MGSDNNDEPACNYGHTFLEWFRNVLLKNHIQNLQNTDVLNSLPKDFLISA